MLSIISSGNRECCSSAAPIREPSLRRIVYVFGHFAVSYSEINVKVGETVDAC
jgi:hypothetical protein